MEHDINKSIQEKIRMTEASPVAWQKERTWERIKDGMPHSRKRYRYYAAAAAVCLMAISVWYTGVRYENNLLNARIIALTGAIDALNQGPLQYPLREERPDPRQCDEERPVQLQPEKNVPALTTPVKKAVLQAQARDSLPTQDITIQDQATIMVAVDDIPSENERVAPIIGVFEHPSPEVAISKKNRSKLRIRREQERRSDDGPEHKIIIARIN